MSDDRIGSYPTVFAIGHSAILDIFNDSVIVEEKIDGSQFSFGMVGGELLCRSKGKQIVIDAPEKMFERAVESALARKERLHPDWIYRCEYLEKPHHNTLCYERHPIDHLIGFDIATGIETYLTYEDKKDEFERIGLECVPLLCEGRIGGVGDFLALLDNVSILGGSKIEGVVVKNYKLFTPEKKVAIGKFVSEAFKEIHGGEWRKNNPTQTDILDLLVARYRTPARWQKAVLHLREQGVLEGSPRDIGALILEIQADTKKECADEIKDILFEHFWTKISRGVIAGSPEWYKEQLLQAAFEQRQAASLPLESERER